MGCIASPLAKSLPAAGATGRVSFAQALPVALLLGAAMSVSLAPIHAWWFAPPCLAALFYLLGSQTPLRSAACGFAFGLGWFGIGLWWVVQGLMETSEAGVALSAALGALLIGYLSLFPAAAGMVIGPLSRIDSPWLRAAALASAWTLCDWLRGSLMGGMPMLASGSAHSTGPLAGYAPLAGVHGLGLLNALAAALLAQWLRPRALWPVRAARLAAVQAVALAALLLAGQLLRGHPWTADSGTLSVRIVQADQRPAERSGARSVVLANLLYARLVEGGRADLTVLPETALPIQWDAMPPVARAQWQQLANRNGAIVLGAMASAPAQAALIGDSSNSAFGLLPGADQAYRYDKVKLVPLAERMPQSMAWLARLLSVQFGGLLPGTGTQAPLRLAQPDARVALAICYENQFGHYMAQQASQGQVLAVLNSLAWGHGTYAAAQYTQASQLRALETGRWVLQASNGGPSALIDPDGTIVDALPEQATGVLAGRAGLRDGATPYMHAGDTPLLLAMLAALLTSAWKRLCN